MMAAPLEPVLADEACALARGHGVPGYFIHRDDLASGLAAARIDAHGSMASINTAMYSETGELLDMEFAIPASVQL